PNRDLARNELHLSKSLDGLLHLHGTFTDDIGAALVHGVELKADELFGVFTHAHNLDPDVAVRPRKTLRAMALAELVRVGGARDIHATTPARPEITLVFHAGPPLPQDDTNHPTKPDGDRPDGDEPDGDEPDGDEPDGDEPDGDAPQASEPVDDTAEHEPDGDEPDGDEPDRDGAETEATRVDDAPGGHHPAETPAETPTETPAETAARIRRGLFGALGVTDEHGVLLQDGTKRMVLCDPDLFAIVVDSLGVPLDMGCRVRLATDAQRRALAAMYGGCCFPGCDKPIHSTEIHHTDPFEEGGHTDLSLLIPVCRCHHGICHRHRWRAHVAGDGWVWFQTASGRTFWSERHGRRRPDPAPPPET
ncbi:MAG: hypothetical protein HYX32_10955, partial [Actinobacteria bacterium]|nr:hypothetical protein [Actinomycetota bacterium]